MQSDGIPIPVFRHIDFAAAFKKVTEVGIETEGLLDDLAVGR